MPFIPHTEQDIAAMYAKLGIKDIKELFAEIPQSLQIEELKNIPPALAEFEISKLMQKRASKDQAGLCFIGAGAYEHYIPAPVWEIAGRGELMTAYTPYQAEASQGTLQITYEFQSMICNLLELEVANASLYDGASAVGEAALMAVRANRRSKSKKILMPRTLHPSYRSTARTIASPQGVEFTELPYDKTIGNTPLAELEKFANADITAVLINQPNFFGVLEEVDLITDWAHGQGALVIAVVNPLAMAVLKAPGEWGETGADIVVGDGQPLGIPLASGGPYFGFMACKQELVRTMPGRIIGKTTDSEGKSGYVLNLQAREQHIRRAKATSNICSNQALMAAAATIHMSLMGAEGLQRVATSCHANAIELRELLITIPGVNTVFNGPIFHEFVLQFKSSAKTVLEKLSAAGIQGGYDLTLHYPELGEAVLVCATETKTAEDLEKYKEVLASEGIT